MTNTTNYNLILTEGTDLVNYLTQTNPNFTSLDTIIKGVSDATVTTATEVTVGTAHAISRTLPDANVIRFVATSNWVTGDTMTVDGVTVSALKTDGTTLKSGDYIIGATVIGVLDSTRFTVFVSSAAPTAAADITYDNTSSGLSANDVQNAIDKVDAKLTNGWVTLNGNIDYCIRANIVYIKIKTSGVATLATLPTSLVPPIAIHFYIKLGANYAEGYIDTSGNIIISDSTVGWLTNIISYPISI